FLWRHRGGLSLKFWRLEEVAQRAQFFTLPSIHLTRRNARKRQSLFDREEGVVPLSNVSAARFFLCERRRRRENRRK
ncbi:MAG: hypothetical protein NWS78_06325, partial [Gammaproteobacteria bacterium]|nr:hypothetical protein [Gammaproteobacteria bacterium]